METQNVRIIKKYRNRKLYDCTDSRYVSNQEILKLYRESPQSLVVIKNDTNEDITVSTIASAVSNDAQLAARLVELVRGGTL